MGYIKGYGNLGVVTKNKVPTGIQCLWLLHIVGNGLCSLNTTLKEVKHILDVGFQNKYAMDQLQLSKYAANICSKRILLFYIHVRREQDYAAYIFNSLQL